MNNIYVKKLIKKIKFKECEYNTIKSMIEHYNHILTDNINSVFSQNNIINQGEFYKTLESKEIDEEQCTIIEEYDNFSNLLYKQLALKTHPDKTDNYNSDFIIIKEAYDNKNVLRLIDYANTYNLLKLEDININLLILILEKRLFQIKNKVTELKNTLGYHFLIHNKTDAIKTMQGIIDAHNV